MSPASISSSRGATGNELFGLLPDRVGPNRSSSKVELLRFGSGVPMVVDGVDGVENCGRQKKRDEGDGKEWDPSEA